MKKIFFLMLCMVSFSAIGFAQDKEDMQKARQKKSSNIDSTREEKLLARGANKENLEKLNLTKEQQIQMDDLYKKMQDEKQKVNNDNSLTDAQKEEKINQINKQAKKQLSKILTKEHQDMIMEQQKAKKSQNKNTTE